MGTQPFASPLMYQQHASNRSIELFLHRPYQVAAPEEAAFIFIGLDANYAEDLERPLPLTHEINLRDDEPD